MSIPFKGLPSVSPIQQKFEKLMQINKHQFNSIWDKMFLAINQTIVINPIELDKIIHDLFGDYEPKSMNEIVLEKYGKEALDLIESLM